MSSSITSSFIICQFYFQANVILILGNTYSRVADSRNVNKPEGVFKKSLNACSGREGDKRKTVWNKRVSVKSRDICPNENKKLWTHEC
ncbi:hypothetical protein DWZ34_16345 [Phocaeicola plebeius]|uniref:Uncharacterized protein n=1 Tax=Phocaeicola plebeius TaxID=310297 RepID=A0A415SSV9_9BACT|nr:hypothetical protein DWZ34_16345 [Phocaeicola plebeius]